MSNVFQASHLDVYKGAGYALAAVRGGQVVDLVYFHAVLPEDEMPRTPASAKRAADDQELRPAYRRLLAKGDVVAGMCSCGEFVAL